MIARELKITSRAAQDLVGELGLREAMGAGDTGRGDILSGVKMTARFISSNRLLASRFTWSA